MIKNTSKKFLLMTLALSIGLMSSCAGWNTGDNKESGSLDYDIYSLYVTDKVLRDGDAPSASNTAAFEINAAKGEWEGDQILVRPNSDVKDCSLAVGKLSLADGTEFPAENIKVYYQKYIEVKKQSDGYPNAKLGWYPDMLLPMETAAAYKENTISANENQGLLVYANVSAEQKPGVYSGVATLTLDGNVTEIPVSVEVKDVVLPEVKHLKTCLNTDYELVIDGELDDTLEMYEAYMDAFVEYCVTPRILPGTGKSFGVETFKAAVRKYYDKISSYEIPIEPGGSVWDPQYLMDNILAVAEISLEDDVNYFEKARTWLYTVDEADLHGTHAQVNERVAEFHQIVASMANEVLALDVLDNDNVSKEMLAESIGNMQCMITNPYSDKLKDVDIYVSGARTYDSEVDDYTSNDWLYHCNANISPRSNYHLDDMNNLVSGRLLGAICDEFDIAGILYYETVYYQSISFTGGFHYEKCDPYEDAMRYPGTNGDGWILYPGARYGIKGPIASNRLAATRDAVEDYELLYQLRQLYTDAGYDASEITSLILNGLYANVAVYGDSEKLFDARERLFDLFALAKDGVFVNEVTETAEGYKVVVKGENAEVKLNGAIVTATGDQTIINAALNSAKTSLDIKTVNSELNIVLGGEKEVVLDYSVDGAKGAASNPGYTNQIVSGVVVGESSNVEQIDLIGNNHYVFIRPTDLSNYLNSETAEIVVTVYNPSAENATIELSIEGNGIRLVQNKYNLKLGKNELKLKCAYGRQWKSLKNATGIVLNVEGMKTLYLGTITATGVAK